MPLFASLSLQKKLNLQEDAESLPEGAESLQEDAEFLQEDAEFLQEDAESGGRSRILVWVRGFEGFESSRVWVQRFEVFKGVHGFEGLIVRQFDGSRCSMVRGLDSPTVRGFDGAREFEASEYQSIPST